MYFTFQNISEIKNHQDEWVGLQENDLPLDSIVRLIERELLHSLGKELPPVIQANGDNLL